MVLVVLPDVFHHALQSFRVVARGQDRKGPSFPQLRSVHRAHAPRPSLPLVRGWGRPFAGPGLRAGPQRPDCTSALPAELPLTPCPPARPRPRSLLHSQGSPGVRGTGPALACRVLHTHRSAEHRCTRVSTDSQTPAGCKAEARRPGSRGGRSASGLRGPPAGAAPSLSHPQGPLRQLPLRRFLLSPFLRVQGHEPDS